MASEQDVWENLPLVERVARRVGIDGCLVSDLGLEVLRSAAKTHKPERGEFKPYAQKCLYTAMLSYKQKQGLSMPSFEQMEPEILDTSVESIGVSIDQLRELVSEEEYELLYDWFVSSSSRAALEAKYGLTRVTLWVRVQKLLKRVKKV